MNTGRDIYLGDAQLDSQCQAEQDMPGDAQESTSQAEMQDGDAQESRCQADHISTTGSCRNTQTITRCHTRKWPVARYVKFPIIAIIDQCLKPKFVQGNEQIVRPDARRSEAELRSVGRVKSDALCHIAERFSSFPAFSSNGPESSTPLMTSEETFSLGLENIAEPLITALVRTKLNRR